MTVISKKCNCRNEIENLIKLGLSILLDYFILIGTMFLFNIWDQKAINYMYGLILSYTILLNQCKYLYILTNRLQIMIIDSNVTLVHYGPTGSKEGWTKEMRGGNLLP